MTRLPGPLDLTTLHCLPIRTTLPDRSSLPRSRLVPISVVQRRASKLRPVTSPLRRNDGVDAARVVVDRRRAHDDAIERDLGRALLRAGDRPARRAARADLAVEHRIVRHPGDVVAEHVAEDLAADLTPGRDAGAIADLGAVV